MTEKNNLRERRNKVKKNLKSIVDNFKEIEEALTPGQKKNNMSGLGKQIRFNYLPIKRYEQISVDYTDVDGKKYKILVSHDGGSLK